MIERLSNLWKFSSGSWRIVAHPLHAPGRTSAAIYLSYAGERFVKVVRTPEPRTRSAYASRSNYTSGIPARLRRRRKDSSILPCRGRDTLAPSRAVPAGLGEETNEGVGEINKGGACTLLPPAIRHLDPPSHFFGLLGGSSNPLKRQARFFCGFFRGVLAT